MALDSLTFKATLALSIAGTKNLTGSDYSPIQSSSNINKVVSLGTSVANAVAGGADECASFIVSIAASGTATVDLTSLTDVLNATGVSLARVKSLTVRLLSAADDAALGTAASSVTVGNNAANDFVSQSNTGWFGSATSTLVVPNGGFVSFGVGNAGGVLVDATHKIIKLANNDAGLTAKVQVTVAGGTT